MKTTIALCILPFFATYLAIGFVLWNFDVSTWAEGGRFCIIWFGSICAIGIGLFKANTL